MAKPHETTEVHEESHQAHQQSFFAPDISMALLTWVTFFLLLAILYKFAWKPILTALDQREETLRKSLEEADRLKAELEKIEQTRQEMLQKAETQGKQLIDESRKAAAEAAVHIKERAREESQILLENAKREIHDETQKARATLKQDSIDIAVNLAAKLIEKNITKEKNKRIINQFIKEN